MRRYYIYSVILLLLGESFVCNAQFNTIENTSKQKYVIISKPKKSIDTTSIDIKDSTIIIAEIDRKLYREVREKAKLKSRQTGGKNKQPQNNSRHRVTGLTLTSLYDEIIKNKIQHPKIVLAQAILETGWFKSSVCRNKGNLFGLTNPRTGQYYEFDDWRESVKAYYDKVQYRYKGGNYLLWLKKIGYAEDPRYVSSLMDILEKHLL